MSRERIIYDRIIGCDRIKVLVHNVMSGFAAVRRFKSVQLNLIGYVAETRTQVTGLIDNYV